MAVASLGVVGSATANSLTGPLTVPITVDVPASDPANGATVVFIFASSGWKNQPSTPSTQGITDSATRSGRYAACDTPNLYRIGEVTGFSWGAGGNNSSAGLEGYGIIFYPLRAGIDSIIIDAGNGTLPLDVSVLVLAWTGVQTNVVVPAANPYVTGGQILGPYVLDYDIGPQVSWDDATFYGLGPQTDFPQSDQHTGVKVVVNPPAWPPPTGTGNSWQFEVCDLALYSAFDFGHSSDITITDLTWYDPNVTTLASVLNFYSPLADSDTYYDGARFAYTSIVVGQSIDPSLFTPGDVGITWEVTGTPTNTEVLSVGTAVAFVAGPGPLTCGGGGLHIWRRI